MCLSTGKYKKFVQNTATGPGALQPNKANPVIILPMRWEELICRTRRQIVECTHRSPKTRPARFCFFSFRFLFRFHFPLLFLFFREIIIYEIYSEFQFFFKYSKELALQNFIPISKNIRNLKNICFGISATFTKMLQLKKISFRTVRDFLSK